MHKRKNARPKKIENSLPRASICDKDFSINLFIFNYLQCKFDACEISSSYFETYICYVKIAHILATYIDELRKHSRL